MALGVRAGNRRNAIPQTERQRYRASRASAAAALLLTAVLAGCTSGEPDSGGATAVSNLTGQTAPTAASGNGSRAALGPVVKDSFGNADFYTSVDGDTPAVVAGSFRLSEAKLREFNGIPAGQSLLPGTKLRLLPAPGPITGAAGPAALNGDGIPTSYVVAPNDTLGGITYRFGITGDQLAEANMVPYTYEKGNVYFVRAGRHLQLQKNPVDQRAGKGAVVTNSFGGPVYYTTIDGDSLDSIGYQFRSTTEQLLQYNPGLAASPSIPPGTRVRLIPGELAVEGATGSFTAGPDGVPVTYTTAPGDTERQVEFRFKVSDLRAANRPLTGPAGSWYDFKDLPNGELTPGQTISVALNKPINK